MRLSNQEWMKLHQALKRFYHGIKQKIAVTFTALRISTEYSSTRIDEFVEKVEDYNE